MTRASRARDAALALPLLLSLLACGGRESERIDPDQRSAVLCVWEIYSTLQIVGELCAVDPADPFQGALRDSVSRLESFITDNTRIPQSQLDAGKRRKRLLERQEKAQHSPAEIAARCRGDGSEGAAMYQELRARDPEEIRREIGRLLEVPPQKVTNPCS
ncbi:MAG: hypothetical protein WDO24_08885 [Pseudomonadota bacterium]